jgi:hypothetical protein
VNVAGGLPFTWAASTGDVRALQKPGASDRLAACWYAPGFFTIDVNFTDGKSHPVALYLLDWDNMGRTERVDVLDASNDVLSSTPVSGFNNGTYLKWNLAGHVILRVSNTGGVNAVASGLFFGQPGAPQLAAPGPGPGGQDVSSLTDPDLAPILAAAEDRLIATGLSAAEAQVLCHATAVVTDLPPGYLGRTALGGSVVYLDATASGYGWFLDPTPLDDNEFPLVTASGLLAPAGSPAAGRMDLLTVVMHELEHVLGLNSVYGGDPANLMDAYLAPGERRLPCSAAAGLAQSATAVAVGREGLGASSPASFFAALELAGPSSAKSVVSTPGPTAVGFSEWTIPDWWFLSEGFGRSKQQPWDTDEVVVAA